MDAARHYLDLARSDVEVYHALLDLGVGAVPTLWEEYLSEPDPSVRSLIVHVIWQTRSPSVVDMIAEALGNPSPDVWKEALDGLVTLATPEAERALTDAAGRESDAEKRAWIDEAIEQVSVGMWPERGWAPGAEETGDHGPEPR
jgi:HEAT repeat protein